MPDRSSHRHIKRLSGFDFEGSLIKTWIYLNTKTKQQFKEWVFLEKSEPTKAKLSLGANKVTATFLGSTWYNQNRQPSIGRSVNGEYYYNLLYRHRFEEKWSAFGQEECAFSRR